MISKKILFLSGVTLFIAHCSEVPVQPTQEDAARQTTAEEPKENLPEIAGSVRAQALQFTRFLKNQLNESETNKLKAECQKELDAKQTNNPFCYSIVNFDTLQANLKKGKKGPPRPSRKRVRAKVVKGEVTNWDELRAAPINGLLRGLGAAGPSELRTIEEKTKAETRCPNNIAIALAATLEDDLPERISPLEVAELYRKGAMCPIELPADQETLLCRAGLFFFLSKKFKEAEEVLAKASKIEKAYTGRSLYWLHRTKLALDDTSGANGVLDQMKNRYPFSFHTLVALSASNRDPGDVLKKNWTLGAKRSQITPVVNQLVEQIEILRRMEMKEASAKVLSWAIQEAQEAEPEVRLYLAELKDESNDLRVKITLMSDVLYNYPSFVAKETLELYFPKMYFPVFERNSGGIDPYFLLSVARQESAFNAKAISTAKAKGLMQVQPATGRRFWSKKKMDLTDPDTNVQIGARYLQELMRRVNGQVHFALAAYNAGENRLTNWETRYQTTEPVLFIDLIPFRETREYVASILRNYFWYRRIHAPADGDRRVFDLNITRNESDN